ncbi:Methionine ABC transporter substrate-binding protein [Micrococcus lylae]|uniref:Methionine ABC transporter substrate-binding protein n=1 Tax=Micrococcus lylae TaxID=1273 RepID=A0A1R4IEG3_9MICC|nr:MULTISPECIES: MetQ/NlpA family ABC transporter substrate-binding protein [Micrococcus]MCT2008156.1 MetQ/NlpA family ABC transporter substrate-binding protein [Micrococcus lylae]MCT2072089.1 MetQ/NlpA family ABC transporter substrate-binding protein [Micrococcus lylae]OFR90495.1 NLPA lipoprotein [Micrococcus sp. HMSC067E09]PNL17918.1 NLPA lipoprotein [Micrococcus sp. FDAARGOS_333]TFI00892.1 NLPA lipoprotein [Micrococcus lylae]
MSQHPALSRRSFGALSLAAVGSLALSACNSQAQDDSANGGKGKIVIGIVGENETNKLFVELAKKELDLDVEIRNFTEYTQPNPALENGDIQMNWFQHIAYLADYNEASGSDLVMIGSTEIIPLPLYSKKYKDVEDFQKGDTVAIPNDTVNQGRAIGVLVQAGLVTLKNDTIRPEPKDIDESASTVKVQPVAAQQTVNALESVQGAVINNDFSADAGIDTNTALFQDDPSADAAKPFVNGFVVRQEDKDDETYKKLAELYHNQQILDSDAELSSGTSVPVQLEQDEIDRVTEDYQAAIAEQGS